MRKEDKNEEEVTASNCTRRDHLRIDTIDSERWASTAPASVTSDNASGSRRFIGNDKNASLYGVSALQYPRWLTLLDASSDLAL